MQPINQKTEHFSLAEELTQSSRCSTTTWSTLQEAVEMAMGNYFSQLGETTPANLLPMVLAEVEVPLMKAVLHRTHFNRLQAAKQLGISRTTFHKKIRQYGLDVWMESHQAKALFTASAKFDEQDKAGDGV
tara:strand:+ start:315 stop:707 length:393 start_codon:yes stop_codon:yes gene_type:complete